jgi:CRP/FNR family cyclic AMP-dependent transcriptional regulator
MLTLDEAKEIAGTRGWLSQTPGDFRRAVLGRVALQSFKPGQSIYSIDDPPGGMYGLVSGSVKISVAPGDDVPVLAHIMTPGSWSGYGPAVTGRNRIAGLSAGRNCRALFLPLHAINEIAARDPLTWRYIAALVLSDLKISIGAMDDLMIRDEFRRMIAVLLRAGGFRHGDGGEKGAVWLDLSQSELAAMSNLARTTAGTFLHRLEAEGEVEIRYGQIGVLAPEALRARLVASG